MASNGKTPQAYDWNMNRICERLPTLAVPNRPPPLSEQFPPAVGVKYLVAENPTDRMSCIMTAARLITHTQQLKAIDLFSYTASILCNIFPALESSFLEATQHVGGRLVKRYFPDGLSNDIVHCDDPRVALMVVAQTILLMFINFNGSNYYQIIANHAAAVSSILGIEANVVYGLEKAASIRRQIGASNILRSAVITQLMHLKGNDYLGRIGGYLCSTLAWTDMSKYTLIQDMLLKTKSPVLFDPRVAAEVHNLYRACTALARSSQPQFFRILQNYHHQKKLDASNFPTLLGVAQRLKNKNNKPAAGINDDLVDELVRIHEACPRNLNALALPDHAALGISIDHDDQLYDIK